MSPRLRRIAALLMGAASAIVLFTGCGTNGESSNTGKGEATQANTSSQSTSGKIQLPYAGEEVVYKGYAADLGIKEDSSTPIVAEYRKRVGNVRIEWQTAPWTDYNEKVKLALNSGDLPDIIWMNESYNKSKQYGPAGIFLDWNKYKDLMPNWQAYVSQNAFTDVLVMDKGERYSITDIEPYDYPMEGFFYNNTVLQKLGIAVPTTFDEFIEAMRQLKKADPAIIPYQSYWNLWYTKSTFANILNAHEGIYLNTAASKWEYALTSPNSNYKKLIETMTVLFKEKLINPEIATMSQEQEMNVLAGGNWGFTYVYSLSPEEEIFKSKTLPIDVKAMTPPSSDGRINLSITTTHDGFPGWGYFANANVKNPELLAVYVDQVISKNTSELWSWGIEGVTYTKDENGKKQFIPELINGTKKVSDFGLQNFMDPRYVHYKLRSSERALYGPLFHESYNLAIEGLKSGKITPVTSVTSPLFTQEQSDEVSKIMSPINTYVDENIMKFIVGSRNIAEWDDFVAKVKSLGNMDRVLEIYNSAKQYTPDTKRLYEED